MKQREYCVELPCTLLPFLLSHLGSKSRNSVKAMLTRGQIHVDGSMVTQYDHLLSPGQTVTVLPLGSDRQKAPFPVLYEDNCILVIEKPAGLLSIASDRERLRTAYRMATDYVRRRSPNSRIFIVHRLDRDTSGVLLFAKDAQTKHAYQDNWSQLVRRRGYLAVVEGRPPKPQDTICTLLRENSAHKVYSVRSLGKKAITHYTTLQTSIRYTLLEAALETGRKNQIRAHLSELGCPIAGDRDYGAVSNPLGRLCLHAHELVLAHPVSGTLLTFRAEAPKEFWQLTAPAHDLDRR